MYVTHWLHSPEIVSIKLTSNTAYENVVFHSRDTVDNTYEPLENYKNIAGDVEDVYDVIYNYPTGSDSLTGQVITDQHPVHYDDTERIYI